MRYLKLNNIFILLLILFSSLSDGFSQECSLPSSVSDARGITISDSSDSLGYSSKQVTINDHVSVEGLDSKTFDYIKNDPQLIADIFGAKLVSQKSKTDFEVEVPGILGFDLKFRVQLDHLKEGQSNVKLSEFNTFFYEGEGEVSIFPGTDNSTIVMKGSAYVPKTAARIFIFGVGGESNFKKLVQAEVDKQIQLALDRFKENY